MADHAHSTPAPAVQAGLLPLVPVVFRPAPLVEDHRTADDLLREIAEEIDRQLDAAQPDLPAEPLLPADVLHDSAGIPKSWDTPDAIRADLDALLAEAKSVTLTDLRATSSVLTNDTPFPVPAPLPSLTTALSRRRAIFEAVGVYAEAGENLPPNLFPETGENLPAPVLPNSGDLKIARTLHLRRQLAQAAEHGAALLASLGLPRLVGPDFVPLDPAAAGDAVEAAVAALDALDGDVDLEDGGDDELSLGWEKPSSQLFLMEGAFSGDRELDTADAEPSLASPERHPEPPPFGYCARYGAYVDRSSAGTQIGWAEGAQDDRELVPEDGAIDEDELNGAGEVDAEPSIGWPEDFTAEVEATLEASADAEHDDADLEDDVDDDPGAEPWWSFDRSTVIEVVPHV